MIPLAHGDLGSADEIIPAILAGLLLIFVLVRALVDFVKGHVHRGAHSERVASSENTSLEAEVLD